MGRFLNYLNSAPLNLCVEGTQALILETLGEQWNAWWITGIYLIGELFCYLWNLQEHQQIIFTLGYLLNKYYSVSLLYTHGKTFALYAGTNSHLSFVPFFFHRKNSKLNLPSAHSKSKQLILITQDYGNSCWLVNHYVLLMSEKEGRVKQNSPLKNYSATKIFFFYHGNTTLVSTTEMLHVDFLSTHKKRLNNSHNTGGLSINAKSCVAKTCNHDNRMSAK